MRATLIRRLGEALVPTRLGRGFRWLVASSWTTNIGDGVALAAGPLLVASQTSDPRLVALAAALQRVPWLLLGLVAGVLADRWDRRRILVVANLGRTGVLALLCTALLTDNVDVTVVLLAMLALGLAEVFADTASQTLTPMLVPSAHLGAANARIQAGYLTANQLVGPPLGAFLFALGAASPFAAQAVTTALGVVLVLRIGEDVGHVRRTPSTTGAGRRGFLGRVGEDLAGGVRWLWAHGAMRTLALVIFSFNITWAAGWGVLVLWSLERVDMGEVGFGLLTTAAAVGGLLATVAYGRLESRFDLATLMKTCLLLEVLMHLGLALTTDAWVALAIMVGFGAYAFVWHTVSVTVRQRAVPLELQGRVGSVYAVGVFGGMVVGQVLGGLLAQQWGLTAPFWFAFAGSAVTLALVWRQLDLIAHPDSDTRCGPGTGAGVEVRSQETDGPHR